MTSSARSTRAATPAAPRSQHPLARYTAPRSAPAAARTPPDPAAEPVPETGLETGRAGALFLLHLFERPDLAPALPEAARAAPWTAAACLAAALHPDPSPPGAPDPLAALMEALDGPSGPAPGGGARDPAEAGRFRAALDRALSPILPDLRARLAAAMGVAPETAGPRLVARRGRVFVTAMHVDLTLPLADADAADLRRAAAGDSPGTVGAAAEAARSFRDAALRLAESVGAAYRAEAAALDGVAPPPYYA